MAGFVHRETMLESPPRQDVARASTLRVLAYFDIFHYPLDREEIRQFMDRPVADKELGNVLNELLNNNLVFVHAGFFSLQDNPLLAMRRLKGNERAEVLLQKAYKIGRFLYSFPFVRGIGISGSLSKGFADADADIDFFIITSSNRLWVARTLMHLFKKFTFLTGKQHNYCMNYYLDEAAMQLNERNIFTAMEIRTLLPVCGQEAMEEFIQSNDWSSKFLPSCDRRYPKQTDAKRTLLKGFLEILFAGWIGNRLDNYLYKTTRKRWARKEKKGKQNKKGMTMGLDTDKHFARSNPDSFQEKVLSIYQQKINPLNQL